MGKKPRSGKNNGLLGRLLTILLLLALGGAAGYLGTLALDRSGALTSRVSGGEVLLILTLVASLYLAFILQVILHEAGHLVFGLWTGYRFCSCRVFSWMWVREDGKLQKKRFRLAGTAGQCLMGPPENWKTAPVALYHLGGVLMNLITAALSALLYLLCRDIPFLGVFWVMMALAGVIFALTNGLPVKMGAVNNDGSNLREILRSPDARRAVWQQMKTVELLSRGVRLRDMPEECFVLPREADLSGTLVAAVGANRVSRLLDRGDLAGAEAESAALLDAEAGLIPLHRALVLCDRDFCRLVLHKGEADLTELRSKAVGQILRQLSASPSVLRTRYAVALLHDRDAEAAARIRKSFDRLDGRYPYPVELVTERELMALAEAAAGE